MVRAQHLDFFGGRRPSEEEALQFQAHVEEAGDDRMVFLSDVWLDKPATHDRLRAIFEGMPSPHAGEWLPVYCPDTTVHAAAKANFPTLALGLPEWRITSCIVAKWLCC